MGTLCDCCPWVLYVTPVNGYCMWLLSMGTLCDCCQWVLYVTAVHGYFIHSYRWQYFAFLPWKLNHISPLFHITWSGVLGVSWEDDTCGCTRNCHIYISWEALNPKKCSPSLCISLTPVLFYKLNDLITHLYNGFHMNILHPIFIPQCFSRWHILFCTETGMHQKLANVSALCSADIELCTFLTLSLDREEWLASHPWHCITMASQ